jgi:hypothetical protein
MDPQTIQAPKVNVLGTQETVPATPAKKFRNTLPSLVRFAVFLLKRIFSWVDLDSKF